MGNPMREMVICAGDEICRLGMRILVNGRGVATAHARDPAGRPMPVWSGCRRLGEHQIFLLNEPPQSFDGRYFGPMPRSQVIGKTVPLWLWTNDIAP